mmetsp:Transcript_7899/g.7132  ORF Transcript_7899/g.7132 Transcript_7899/m.7132 type:complete len:445 (+) Transcript_7899:107-1441(+)
MSSKKKRERRSHEKDGDKDTDKDTTTTNKKKSMKSPGNRGRPKKTSKPSSTSPKTKKTKKPKAKTKGSKKEQDALADYDSDKGYYESMGEDSEGKKVKIRRSSRLRDVREMESEESSSESEPETKPKKRKRSPTKSTKDQPPKKKAKKTGRTTTMSSSRTHAVPNFIGDDEYLTKIGIAYTKTKNKARARNLKRKPKLFYHRQSTFKGKAYKYNSNGYYNLVLIKGHKLVYDPNEILRDDPDEKLWYDSINIKDVKKYIDGDEDMINNMDEHEHDHDIENNHNHNDGNGNGDGDHHNDDNAHDNIKQQNDEEEDDDIKQQNGHGDGKEEKKDRKTRDKDKGKGDKDESEDIDLPQVHFGIIMFECKWDNWPVTTWERWDVIQHTAVFEHYCEQKTWTPDAELYATIQEHTQEQFQTIVCNMAHFGNPTLRKALKLLVNRELNVW